LGALLDPSTTDAAEILKAETETLFALLPTTAAAAEGPADQRVEKAEVQVRHLALEHEARAADVARINALSVPLHELAGELDALTAQERRLDRTAARAARWLSHIKRTSDAEDQTWTVLRDALSTLANAHEDCLRKIPEVVTSDDVTAAEAMSHYRDLPKTNEELQERYKSLKNFAEGLPLYWLNWNNLQQIELDLAREDRPATAEDLKKARDALERANAQVKGLKAQVESAGTAGSALRHAAQGFIETCAPLSGDCPVCGQDWETPEGLQAALRQVLDAMPKSTRRLEADLLAAEAKRKSNAAHVADLERRLRLQKDAAELRRYRESVDREAERLQLGTKENGWQSRLLQIRHHLDSGAALQRFLPALDRAEALLELQPGLMTGVSRRYHVVMGAWSTRSDRYEALRQRYSGLVLRLADKQSAAREKLRSTEDRLKEVRRKLEPARASWSSLSTELYTSQRFSTIRDRVDAEGERLKRAERSLKVIRDLQEAAQRRSGVNALKKEIDTAKQRLARFTELNDQAFTAQNAIDAHRDKFIRMQMTALMPHVESLFGRVHANKVFDRLLNDKNDPLAWFGEFRGQRVDPKEFSQGQRQDLALAIFLARACSLKGTFFLDEPLAHLDDLNRVAALDILRMIALTQPDVHLVVTTANRVLARHIKEKFGRLEKGLVRILALEGGPAGDLSIAKA
jgi:DNA repair exonuclease SbcCD ATPase subunit